MQAQIYITVLHFDDCNTKFCNCVLQYKKLKQYQRLTKGSAGSALMIDVQIEQLSINNETLILIIPICINSGLRPKEV